MKFLNKVVLILTLPILVPNSYAMHNEQGKIIIKYKNNQKFIITYNNETQKNDLVQALEKSKPIKNMMESVPLKNGYTINMELITRKRFEQYIWPYMCEINKNTANNNFKGKNLDLKTMCNLTNDANCLDIKPLLNVFSNIVAKKLCSNKELDKLKKGKSSYSKLLPVAEINRKIAKIMFEKYIKYDVKELMDEKKVKSIRNDGNDKIVKIFNPQNNEYLCTLNYNNTPTNKLVSKDQKFTLRSNDCTATICNTITNNLHTLDHNNPIVEACFSKNGKLASTVSFDGLTISFNGLKEKSTIKIWNTETGKCERILHYNSHNADIFTFPIDSVCFSKDGSKLIFGSYDDDTIKIWDLDWHKDLTCEQMQLLLLCCNNKSIDPIQHEHLNNIAETLPENAKEIIKPRPSWLKKYLFPGVVTASIVGLWYFLRK